MKLKVRYLAIALIAVFSSAAVSYTTGAQTDTKSISESTARKSPNNSDESKLKVFHIKHANVEQLSSTIRSLFASQPDSTITIVFDQRTNTLIARGSELELEILEVVLLRLDEPVTPKAQKVESGEGVSKASSELEKSYSVQLTEFRVKNSSLSKSASDIVKSLDEMKDNGDIEVIETIWISAHQGHESMMQIGKSATVTVGVTSSPQGRSRNTQRQAIGTIVRVTAEPANGKTLLKLTYEATRFEGKGSEDSPPDTKSFQVNTTMLLDSSKTVLAGGTSADSSTFLAVSVN